MTEQQQRVRLPNNLAWARGRFKVRLDVPECPPATAVKTTKHGVSGYHVEVSGDLLHDHDGQVGWWPGLTEAVAGLYRLTTGKDWWTSGHAGRWASRGRNRKGRARG